MKDKQGGGQKEGEARALDKTAVGEEQKESCAHSPCQQLAFSVKLRKMHVQNVLRFEGKNRYKETFSLVAGGCEISHHCVRTVASYLGWVSVDAVALVVNVSQLFLQVQLDPVVKADDGPTSSSLSNKHVFKTWRVWPEEGETQTVTYYVEIF